MAEPNNQICYMPIRDFGKDGWRLFLSTLLLSNRVDLWLPDGNEINQAHDEGLCPLNPNDILALIESGHVRIGGRERNFSSSPTDAINQSGSTEFDRVLRIWASSDRSDKRVFLHDEYQASAIAREQLESWIAWHDPNGKPTSHTNLQQALVFARHNKKALKTESTDEAVPKVVRDRAAIFLDMDIEDIHEPDIRETFRMIKECPRNQWNELAMATQLVRLSLEHDAIKKAQGCNVHSAERNHATMYQQVAQAEGVLTRERLQPELFLEKVIEILDHILAQSPINSAGDLQERHEKLAPYRDHIWQIAAGTNDPLSQVEQDLKNYASEQRLFRFLGESKSEAALTAGATTDVLRNLICVAVDSALNPVAIASSVLALAPTAFSAHKKLAQHDDRIWPVVAGMNVVSPDRNDLVKILHDLEHFRRKFL